VLRSRMIFLQKSVRLIAWSLLILIIALSLSPPQFRPETGAPHDFEHLAIFAACGFAFGLGYRRKSHFVAAVLIAFAGALELAQAFIPGRHARLTDFVVDAISISVSAVIGGIIGLRTVDQFGAPATKSVREK
jgi:VanZ family protein